MYLNTFQYKPEHIGCKQCTEFVRKKGCTAQVCPWLAELIEAGTVGYREAVMETFHRSPHMDARLHTVIRRFKPNTVSSHFVIEIDGKVIQFVPLNEVAYCSSNRNNNTISIEFCHTDDTDQFSQTTLDALVRLLN